MLDAFQNKPNAADLGFSVVAAYGSRIIHSRSVHAAANCLNSHSVLQALYTRRRFSSPSTDSFSLHFARPPAVLRSRLLRTCPSTDSSLCSCPPSSLPAPHRQTALTLLQAPLHAVWCLLKACFRRSFRVPCPFSRCKSMTALHRYSVGITMLSRCLLARSRSSFRVLVQALQLPPPFNSMANLGRPIASDIDQLRALRPPS